VKSVDTDKTHAGKKADCKARKFGTSASGAMLMLACSLPAAHAEGVALMETPSSVGSLPVRSWKSLHDAGVVRQQHDFSCGAASLATVMGLYGQAVSETEVMHAMGKERSEASFEDMAEVLPQFGFAALGVAVSFDQLTSLQQPVVAYMRSGRREHFTVIRGVSTTHVWLGDPSWGNRIVTRERFLAMWETRDDEVFKGKVLVIQPVEDKSLMPGAFGEPVPSNVLAPAILNRPF
jgi:predicted double-glycine peptidase